MMKFKDYGVVEYFNSDKGFGFVDTIHNGKVFIHKKNINIKPKDGDYVIIREVKKNENKNKFAGYGVIKWKDTIDNLCEEVFKLWIYETPLEINKDLEWLLLNGSVRILEKIINCNKKHWHFSKAFMTLFAECTLKNKRFRENTFANFVTDYFFEIWKNSNGQKYDSNLKRAIGYFERPSLIWEALQFNYRWIHDTTFITTFQNQAFEQRIVFKFLFNKIIKEGIVNYNEDIKWIINNGNNSIFPEIYVFSSLFSDDQFINDFRNARNRYGKEKCCEFLYRYWLYKNDLTFNEDVKFILEYGAVELIKNLIDYNKVNWIHDIEFLKHVRNFRNFDGRRGRNRPSEFYFNSIYVSDEKFEVIENFILSVWYLNDKKEFDDNMMWILDNCKCETISHIVNQEISKWCSNPLFVEYVRELSFHSDYEFKLPFMYEVCLQNIQIKGNENVKWLFNNAPLKYIQQFLIRKLDYSSIFIDSIYCAFYPYNNVNYYNNYVKSQDWSDYFKMEYVESKKQKIEDQFRNIFLAKINVDKEGLIKKKSYKKVTHAATDLASFVFCPISYYINQIYIINIEEHESVFIGTQEHEKQRLLNLSNYEKQDYAGKGTEFANFYTDFSRIINSECVSQGHNKKKPKVYYSKSKKLSGTPDYIFKDSNGYFAVEEKYTTKKYEEITELYLNHKLQALTYLYGLYEFQFDEVYVLYWFVKKDNADNYHVYNYRIFRITKSSDNQKKIIEVFNDLEAIQDRKPYIVEPEKINHRKCIKCNYFPYCDYKKELKYRIELPPINNDLPNGLPSDNSK